MGSDSIRNRDKRGLKDLKLEVTKNKSLNFEQSGLCPFPRYQHRTYVFLKIKNDDFFID